MDLNDLCKLAMIDIPFHKWTSSEVNCLLKTHKRVLSDKAVPVLTSILNSYVELINSGDCGTWNPEEETAVINARKLIKELSNEC